MPDRSVVLRYLRQRCHTWGIALPIGRAPALHSPDDGDEDQGEGQPGLREGDGDSDSAVPSGAARAQLWSYAVLLEVLRNSLALRVLSNSQIFRLTLIF